MLSEAREREIVKENEKLEGKMDRIKREGAEVANKVMVIGAAAAAGFAYGALNKRQGGTSDVPYSVGGKAPLDTVLAIGGAVATLFTSERSKAAPAVFGASAALLGCYTNRLGSAWEAARLGAAPAAAPAALPAAPTTSGPFSRNTPYGMYGNRANVWQGY